MAQPEELCMGCMEPRAGIVCALCGWTEGSPPVSPIFLPPRTVLDKRYLLGRVLGAGGFGITYLAWDLNLDLKASRSRNISPTLLEPGTGIAVR